VVDQETFVDWLFGWGKRWWWALIGEAWFNWWWWAGINSVLSVWVGSWNIGWGSNGVIGEGGVSTWWGSGFNVCDGSWSGIDGVISVGFSSWWTFFSDVWDDWSRWGGVWIAFLGVGGWSSIAINGCYVGNNWTAWGGFTGIGDGLVSWWGWNNFVGYGLS